MLIVVGGRTIEDIGEIECNKCGSITDADYKYVESNNSIQARCLECGAFIKNVKQIEIIKGDDAEKPSDKQVCYIKHFYNNGLLPKTKKRANDLICVLKKIEEDTNV